MDTTFDKTFYEDDRQTMLMGSGHTHTSCTTLAGVLHTVVLLSTVGVTLLLVTSSLVMERRADSCMFIGRKGVCLTQHSLVGGDILMLHTLRLIRVHSAKSA